MNDFIKVKSVYLKEFPVEVVFSLLSEEGKSKLDDYGAAKTIREDMTIFVYLSDDDIPIMVHELFHATELIMKAVGQKIGDPPNELWAYIIEYLTYECLIFLEE